MSDNLIESVTQYYSGKLREHGPNAKGVDWPTEESQHIRFEQLIKVVTIPNSSILDYGCGYGALYDFLSKRDWSFQYIGYDCSIPMLDAAREQHGTASNFSVLSGTECNTSADYVIASGIFNVKLDINENTWRKYVFETVNKLHSLCDKGFAFNCLTSYSDLDKRREDLFYGNPLEMFDFCKTALSRNVALLHDYGLYEFSIIVRK